MISHNIELPVPSPYFSNNQQLWSLRRTESGGLQNMYEYCIPHTEFWMQWSALIFGACGLGGSGFAVIILDPIRSRWLFSSSNEPLIALYWYRNGWIRNSINIEKIIIRNPQQYGWIIDYESVGWSIVTISSVADPWYFGMGPDPRIHTYLWRTDLDPAIFVSDLQDGNKKYFFPKFFCLLLL